MIMQQRAGHWHPESCNHWVKMREIKSPIGDEGHIKDDVSQICFCFIKKGAHKNIVIEKLF
jgi:hypothetical protein